MNVDNLSGNVQVMQFFREAWGSLPNHWEMLIQKLPCEIQILSLVRLKDTLARTRSDEILSIQKPDMTSVHLRGKVYVILCADPFSPEFVHIDGTHGYVFKKNLLRACSIALFHKNRWIGSWIDENRGDMVALAPSKFFLEAFPLFCLNRDSMHKAERTILNGLMVGLDAAVMLRKELGP